ncbi:MAG: peptidoglycan-binding domain-containing protein [Paracoccus sp. (in: a-proteobacteria)]|uniref:peptidoglycan-binding domain-containing protein n=1 Tax=Paracoccus sp. TaxID=267 RepID=UPI0039E3B8A9
MRRFAVILGMALPAMAGTGAWAEDVVIRIEAKRGTDAAQLAAERWAARFPDVVTFPMAEGWVAIALGPMPREEAAPRLQQLKQESKVPGDSFLSPAQGRNLTRLAGAAPAPATPEPPAAPAIGSASTFPQGGPAPKAETGDEPPLGDLAGEDAPAVAVSAPAAPEIAPEAAPEPAAPPQVVIRIESSSDPSRAEAALVKYRTALPEAGLWTLPNGRSAVGFGPMDEATGKAWLRALKSAGTVPGDAFLADADEMGEIRLIGGKPELGAPLPEGAAPLPLPPLDQIQRALRWAGHYQGAIDGKDGPMTQKAIAEEIVRLRASPDPGTAMAELIRRRDAWRTESGLVELRDTHTGLSLPAPMAKLQFDRAERALSIYGPRDGSGAALILFSQPGGQQEMLDLAGLVTALGWVPAPERQVARGSVILDGHNQTHLGHAEGRVVDGQVQGFVLIWPIQDGDQARRISAEISDHLTRFTPSQAQDPATSPEVPATPQVAPAGNP